VLPDAARLEAGPWPAGPAGPVAPAPEVRRVTTEDRRLKRDATWRAVVDTDQPVRDMWVNNEDAPYPWTEPVRAGDLALVAVVSEHRLEARRGDRVAWSLTAGARIASPPLVHEGRVYVASHDGWLYCCELSTGRLLWRALVAPNVRRIVAYGQIESSWPLRNVVLCDGLVCAAAGRHPEIDGGIHVAGLDPATGQPRWRETVAYDSAGQWFSPDDRQRQRHLNWLTNGGLAVRDGRLLVIGQDDVEGGGNKIPRLEPFPIWPPEMPRP
jgi:outer membrane protein assembly factor BamB